MPDMRTPIAYALAWPDRVEAGVKRLNLTEIHKLEFYPPDLESFPGLALAFQVLEAGDNAPVIFNAANEIAVEAFLQERIGFLQIPTIVSAALDVCETGKIDGLDEILEYDRLARETTSRLIHKDKGI
jgi:1-deoxy-D-xylulose-5-phosphate reductoisomerase